MSEPTDPTGSPSVPADQAPTVQQPALPPSTAVPEQAVAYAAPPVAEQAKRGMYVPKWVAAVAAVVVVGVGGFAIGKATADDGHDRRPAGFSQDAGRPGPQGWGQQGPQGQQGQQGGRQGGQQGQQGWGQQGPQGQQGGRQGGQQGGFGQQGPQGQSQQGWGQGGPMTRSGGS